MILDRLTDRQRVLLRRLCAGETYAEIASAEGITVGGVQAARSKIVSRFPVPMRLPEICAAAAEEDPTIVVDLAPSRGGTGPVATSW